jgi:small subunit ribosomal protein S6
MLEAGKGEKPVRTYEVAFIAAPTLTAEELDAFIAQMQAVVEGKNGKVVKVDNWGKKSLAYKIKKFRDGYYVILTVEADGAIIAELERRFRVADHVIRFISVRIDEDLKRAEKMKAARQRKAGSKPVPSVRPADEYETMPPAAPLG